VSGDGQRGQPSLKRCGRKFLRVSVSEVARQLRRLQYIYEDHIYPEPMAHSVMKRKTLASIMFTMSEEEQQPAPTGGARGEGWSPVRPENPEHFVAGVKIERQADGSFVKLFKVMVRPEVVQQKKRKAKNLLKRIKREDAEANLKLAKCRVRALLVMMGKA